MFNIIIHKGKCKLQPVGKLLNKCTVVHPYPGIPDSNKKEMHATTLTNFQIMLNEKKAIPESSTLRESIYVTLMK